MDTINELGNPSTLSEALMTRLAKPRDYGLLGSTLVLPDIRERLGTLCGLYSHARKPTARAEILDQLEQVMMEWSHMLAVDLLENGWRRDGDRDEDVDAGRETSAEPV